MSRRDKLINHWKSNPNSEPPWITVEAVLIYYEFEIDKNGGGSHFQIRHPALIGHEGYGETGEFTIAIKSGKTVKGWVLRDIVEAIEIVGEVKDGAEED